MPAGIPRRVASERPGFFEELQRRHVWRVAVAYAIAAWLLVQVATQVFPFFNIPDWTVRLVVVLLAIGFPVAVAFAWVYELTPEGIRRTASADAPGARPEHETRQIGRKLNAVIIAVLVLAVALLLANQFLWHRGMRGTSVAASSVAAAQPPQSSAAPASNALAGASPLPAAAVAIPEKSVAVLPFANEGEQSQQFFSDGLSEDLITALSQFAGLKVISRNSAFQFRDSKDSSRRIGTLLGVAHLLEGSVQRAGDEVRITATLVNASDGMVLWTRRYDKPYKDLFALQDDITRSVAAALKTKLLTTTGAVVQSDRPPGGNLAAYAAYQRGIAYNALGTEAGFHHAVDAFNDAIHRDPHYAAAYAQLSIVWLNLLATGVEREPAIAGINKAAETALKLDPDSSLAHLASSMSLATVDLHWTAAEVQAQRALQLSPNDAQAQFLLGTTLATLGQAQRAIALIRRALASDPRHDGWYRWLSVYLAARGMLDEARRAVDTAVALQPGADFNHQQLAVVEILRGDARGALAAAQREPAGVWHDIGVTMALQIGSDRAAADAALKALASKHGDIAPFQIAEAYALRRDPDAVFQWLDRAWKERDPGIAYLLFDPFILRYRDDPRFAAFCKRVGLPTTTDAVATE